MPLVDPPIGNPYPTVNAVMDVARARVNDMINDVNGDLLTNDAPYSQTYLSAAWEWLQSECDTVGIETLEKEITLFGVPARFNQDTANRAAISWTGCTDGVNPYEGPVLPQDMISPKSLWRRKSVPGYSDAPPTENRNEFCLMKVANDGLPRWFDCDAYDWNYDSIFFYGDTVVQDFQMRYSAWLPDLDITQPDSLVSIMRCMNALGARVAFEFASARGSAQAATLEAWADKEFAKMKLRSGRRRGRKNIRRQPYSMRFSDAGRNRFPYYTNQ